MNLQELKENKSIKIISTVIVSYFVLIISFYLLIVSPKLSILIKVSSGIKVKERAVKKIGNYQGLENKIEKAKNKMSELKLDIEYYEKMLPTEREIPRLLQYISQIARETNIKLIELEQLAEKKPEEEQSLYVAVPIALTIGGDYHDLGLFMNKIETADRFMKIETFNISSDDETPLSHEARLLIHTYMLWKEKPENDKKS